MRGRLYTLEKCMLRAGNLGKLSYSILLFAVKYTFEKCHPEQVSYQLDFYPMEKSERASYLQLFKDCGWEHITDFNGFPTLESFILELSRMPSLKFIMMRLGS